MAEAKKGESKFVALKKCDTFTVKKDWRRYKKGQKIQAHKSVADKLKQLEVI